ncbi:hypothetical protein H0H93_012363 [Arthromyces matolae]|nr:hypothetical protein H0H93_012363 [Arthromyces matolae]
MTGVTVCLVHLLLLANATPIRSNKLSSKIADQPKPIISTSDYGPVRPSVPDSEISSFTQDVPKPTILSSTAQDVPKSTATSVDSHDDTDSDIDHKELDAPGAAPSAHVMENEHPYRVTYNEILKPNAAKRLVDRMKHHQVTTVSAPWHTKGEWSTEVLGIMTDYLRKRKARWIQDNLRLGRMQSAVLGGTSRSQKRPGEDYIGLDRSKLIQAMDSLWSWVEEELVGRSKKTRVANAQATLRDIESGVIEVDDAKLISTLIASVPVDDHFDPSKMPWHAGGEDVFRWKEDLTIGYVKKVLPYIWGSFTKKRTTLKAKQKVSETQQKLLDGDPERLLDAMDGAWKRWRVKRVRKWKDNLDRYQKRREHIVRQRTSSTA